MYSKEYLISVFEKLFEKTEKEQELLTVEELNQLNAFAGVILSLIKNYDKGVIE